MPAISVGSVEVDVLPNAQGVRRRMQQQLLPAADEVGNELGRVIGRHISSAVADAIRTGVTTGGRTAQAPAARQGQSTGSTFARSLKATLEAALRNLPEIRLHANSTDAEREIAQIRAQIQSLRDARIGIDVSSADAVAAIDHLRERLARLSASDANVAVRVDAGAASAQLAAFQAEVNRLDGQTARVDVDTSTAASNLNLLTTAAIAFGPAIIPALPVVAAGLGSIAAAAVAAGVGLGSVALVALPALKQIGGVLQAQKAAQDAATNSTNQGAQASSQGASKALQMAGAQQALATAERNGAQQIAAAQQQVKQAKQSVADAIVQAGQRTKQAEQQVEQAETSLARAQKDARQAQLDLVSARKEATRQLQDMNNQLVDSQLAQRDAALQVQEAQQNLNAVNAAGSKATALQRQQAQLQYDQAVQHLKEQQLATKRQAADTDAANKAGVKGSTTYKSAQDKVAQAQQNVAAQTKALKDAQASQAQVAVQNARSIATAQQKVADAERNVATAQQSAADSIASAQRQIQSASISAAGGVDQAAVAQAKYRAELAKLTPAARGTFNAFLGLRSAFGDWSRALQPAVMPIFTRALIGLKNALPGLTPFVLAAADAIKGLQDKASAGFKKPWWQDFKKDLATSIGPAITGLGIGFGNLFKGMVGVIDAFLPHMGTISDSIKRITDKFATWGQGLKGSPEFERFLSYASAKAPLLGDTFKKIADALLNIGIAISPVSGPLLQLIGGLAQGLGWIAATLPELVIGMYGLFVATKLWAAAQIIANGAVAAFQAIVALGPWGWIALAIGAVVIAVVLLYNHCAWFRDAVTVVWNAIKVAAQAVVDWFAGPFANFFTKKIPAWFQATLTWVKTNWPWILGALGGPIGLAVVYIIKHWDRVKQGLSDGWTWIKKNVLSPIGTWFTKTIPGWGATLASKIVGAFDTARAGIKLAWDKIKGIARAPVQYVVDVVYNSGIRGVWNAVAGAFGAKKLDKFKFASGGIMPGYTPGRDVHKFVSPTGGALELSGGEAIMRPEFTRAVGSGFVGAMNSIAKSRGSQGVKAALAPAFGGNPRTPTDRSLKYANGGITQRFGDGGIFGWISSAASAVKGAGSAAWNTIKKGASWLADSLEASARAGVKHVVDPLLAGFPGMDTGIGKMIRKIPDKIIDTLFGYSKKADDKGAGGIGGPRIAAALKWAKTQDGKPYQWGGNGNPSYDCSGFMSAIESVIRGQKPHRRWATGAFSGKTAPPGWVLHGNSPFRIGITNAGVGHTAGTLGKTNVESRGGAGIVVGKGARGYKDSLFGSWYGFEPGKYDSGGYLQPGLNLAYNGTGRPEPVFTSAQANALTHLAATQGGASGPASFQGDLYLDSGEFLGKVRGEATQVMQQSHQQLISVLNAT